MITILEHESLEWLTQNTYLGFDYMTQIRMIPQDLVKYSVNTWARIYPPVYPPCPVCQSLLEVDKGRWTATRTRWRHRLDHKKGAVVYVTFSRDVTCHAFDSSRSLVRDCQEDAEIGKFHNSILPTDRNCPWGENSCDTNICHLQFEKFTCHQTLVHGLMDSFLSHILVQLLYNLHLQDVEIQKVTLPHSELSDPINSHHFNQVVHYKEQWSH